MREALQETLSDTIVGVTATVSTVALRAQMAELTGTLSDIQTQTTAMTSTLTGLSAGFSAQMAAQNEALADIRASIRDISDNNRDITFILACLKAKLTGSRDNVIPPEPDPVVDLSVRNPTPTAPAGLQTMAPECDDALATAVGPPPAGGDNVGDNVDIDPLLPGRLGTVDATAHSALASLDLGRSQLDSTAARATAAWRTAHDARASALGQHPVSATPSRPSGDTSRVRHALGATVPTYTQTRLPDLYHARPTLIATETDDGHVPTNSPSYPLLVDTVADTRTWNGGMIQSPRYIDRRRQAVERHVHPPNIEMLADVEYHGGTHGRTAIDMPFVHSCGYRSSISGTDVVTAYGEIILLHASTVERWENMAPNLNASSRRA
jgi:hypothetical protein